MSPSVLLHFVQLMAFLPEAILNGNNLANIPLNDTIVFVQLYPKFTHGFGYKPPCIFR